MDYAKLALVVLRLQTLNRHVTNIGAGRPLARPGHKLFHRASISLGRSFYGPVRTVAYSARESQVHCLLLSIVPVADALDFAVDSNSDPRLAVSTHAS